jgi:hypothetical protein
MPQLISPPTPEWKLLSADIDCAVGSNTLVIPFNWDAANRFLIDLYFNIIGSVGATNLVLKLAGSLSTSELNALTVDTISTGDTFTASQANMGRISVWRQTTIPSDDNNGLRSQIIIEKMFSSGENNIRLYGESNQSLGNIAANLRLSKTFGSCNLLSGTPTGLELQPSGAAEFGDRSIANVYINNSRRQF